MIYLDAKGQEITPHRDVLASPQGAPYVLNEQGIERYFPKHWFGHLNHTYKHDEAENSQDYVIVGDIQTSPLQLMSNISDERDAVSICVNDHCQRDYYQACYHCQSEGDSDVGN